MEKKALPNVIFASMLSISLVGCSNSASPGSSTASTQSTKVVANKNTFTGTQLQLDNFQPKKKSYNFVFTYKLIHPWYDAIKSGADTAVADYAKKGVKITFDWNAPATPDAIDQVNRIEGAVSKNPDVIGVDVTENKSVDPEINKVGKEGIPVITFSGDDAPSSDRVLFVGNDKNKEDGAALAEELAKKIKYEGEVAALAGTIGAPSHEQRMQGFKEVMAKYPKIKVVDVQNDNDDLEQAIQLTENFLQKHPKLKGIFCDNMTNPIGAGQAVDAAGKKGKIVIVGMDHDLRTLNYVKDGTIDATRIQDVFGMGYNLIDLAVKVADGERPGGAVIQQKIYDLPSVTVTKENVQKYIDLLYGKKNN